MDKYNGCFDDFLYFDLRVALVYFLPSEGHLSFGKTEFFCPSGWPSAAPQDKKIQPFLRPKISQIRPPAGPQAKNS